MTRRVSIDRLLPPVQLDDLAHAPAADVGAESEWNDPRRPRMCARDPPNGGLVEVVVVIVREQHDVERRQAIERQRGIHDASRPRPLNGERALTEHRIGEHIEPAELEEHGRMPDPRRGEGSVARARVHDGGCRDWERTARRRRGELLSPALERPSQHVAPSARLAVRPGIAERTVRLTMRPRRSRFRSEADWRVFSWHPLRRACS